MSAPPAPRGSAPVASERPELLVLCGAAGLLGVLAPLAALPLALSHAAHDVLADTVSDLARGPHRVIMDTGFYLNAGGMLALAIGSAHLHLGRWFWSLGILCLALIALVVTLLGIWDEFNSNPDDPLTVHTRLTYALGPLYLAGPLAMARGALRVRRSAGLSFGTAAVLWAVLAAAFKLAPDHLDGGFEKAALAATWFWTVPLALILLRRGIAGVRAGTASGGVAFDRGNTRKDDQWTSD
ncbi:DUF998 domain-containing protein [Roseicyclus sp.]|uniref:DUF998 domain-containing protein n=1 Tax=Roseicyclus sp. TaxID=1914329 RepID=UPI003FA067CD